MSDNGKERVKVGYDWYPNDWKQSDTFLDTDDPLIRYYYREVIDLLYLNGGYWEENKTRFEKAQRVTITADKWAELKALFEVVEKSPSRLFWSHKSVLKRIDGRTFSSAENGGKGGRPKGSKKPIENLNEEPIENLSEPKKPISTIETKLNVKETKPVKVYVSEDTSKVEGSDRSRWPLWGAALREAPSLLPTKKNFVAYYKRLDEAIKSGSIPVDKPGETARAFLFFFPIKIAPQDQDKIAQAVDEFETPGRLSVLESLQSNLVAWAHDRREPPEIIKAMKSFYSGLIEIPEDL